MVRPGGAPRHGPCESPGGERPVRFKPLIALAAGMAYAGAAVPAAPRAEDRPAGQTAYAAVRPAAQSVDARFDQLDRNGDGFLSRDEANDARELETRFSELDVDNDGKLSRDEYRVVIAGEKETLPGATTAASGATHPQ